MINAIRFDEKMSRMVDDNKDAINEMTMAIGLILNGQTYGAGFVSLQISMLCLLNNFNDEERAIGLKALSQFLELNKDRVNTSEISFVAPSTETMQ